MSDFESLIELTNKDAIIASLKSIEGDVQKAVVVKMKDGGDEVKKNLRAQFPVCLSPELHSAPGAVPYSLSGELASKIQATVMPLMLNEPITLNIHVTKKGFYGRMLEFGTSKMAARPWFFSGIARMFPFLKGKTEEALAEVIARRNARLALK